MFKQTKILIALISMLIIVVGCSSNVENEEKQLTNDEVLTALSSGMEKRWEYATKHEDEDTTKNILLEATNIELDEINDYKDLRFEDDKLKELIIAYINELKDGIEALESFGADSFYEKWEEHYSKRTALILEIDSAFEIPISSDYIDIFDELKASGKEVLETEDKKDEIDKFIQSIEFELDQEESDEYFKQYISIVENTTNYNFEEFSLDVKLIDGDGVTVDTEYVLTSNWKKGDKAKLEFMTSEEFEKVELIESYIETE